MGAEGTWAMGGATTCATGTEAAQTRVVRVPTVVVTAIAAR
jgi:hypothetical protein